MRSYNRIFLIGNVAAEPVFNKTAEGKMLLTFPLAVEKNRQVSDKQADYHRIVVWGELSQHMSTYLSKGVRVFLSGKLVNNKYEVADQTKYMTEVHCKEIEVLNFDKKNAAKNLEIPSEEVASESVKKTVKKLASI